jgi:hypothetical protein
MTFRTETIEAPSFLAVAIFNGDESGFSDEDSQAVESFYNIVENTFGKGADITDVSEETFFGRWFDGDGLGHDMATYTILIRE